MGGQTDSQVDASLQNQNLSTDLRWVAKRIRKSALKFTQVAKSQNFHAYTDDLRSTCDQLPLGGETVKTCVDLRSNIAARSKSAHVHTIGSPNETQVERKSKTCVDVSFGQRLNSKVKFAFLCSEILRS